MRAASLNHVYRLVWDKVRHLWIAVAETSRSQGKSSGKAGAVALCSAGVFGLIGSAWALPSDGHVSVGQGQINQSGSALTVTQSSQNLALNWQSFNIAKGEQVRFNQPNSSAVALNRVIGQDASSILGGLTANGQVFLVNPNGVLFGQSAQVSVGGLVASTLTLSNQNLLDGRFKFSGTSTAAVHNSGKITTAQGGYVALLGAKVQNSGQITAPGGNVSLAAGQNVTLQLDNGSLLGLTVNQGAVDAEAANHGLIAANGGKVYLTAEAADALTRAVVNNDGIIEAQTIANHNGSIRLIGDKDSGSVQVGGTLDASSQTGNGGTIESSAAHVAVADNAHITTQAAHGKTGTWLIDPTDFSVNAGNGAQTTSGIGATTLSNALNLSNVSIVTAAAGGQAGDINVNAAVSSTSTHSLNLTALGAITIAAPITLGGDLLLTSAGAVSQTKALTIGGDTTINAGSAPITLTNASNAFAGLVNLTSKGDVAISNSIALQIGTATLGSGLNLSAPSILLNNSINTQGDQIYQGDVILNKDVALTIGTTPTPSTLAIFGTIDGAHSLTMNNNGSVVLGDAVGDNDPLSSLTVVGKTTALNGNVSTLGNQTYVTDLVLGADVVMSSTTGKATFVGSIDNNVLVTPQSLSVNAPNGAVTFIDPLGIHNGALRGLDVVSQTFSAGGSTNSNFLNIGSLGLSIAVSSGTITQSGTFKVVGPSNFSVAGNNPINLSSNGNVFIGAVTAKATGINIYDTATLNIAGLTNGLNGEVRLISDHAINIAPLLNVDSGISALTILAKGGALQTTGSLSGGSISLAGSTGLTIDSAIKALFQLDLSSNTGSITETGNGSISTPSLTANALGAISLARPANKIQVLGAINGGSLDLVSDADLDIKGAINADTVKIQTLIGHSVSLDNTITTTGAGYALVLASGGSFQNMAGPAALTVSQGAHWQLWSDVPGLEGGLPGDFIQYNAQYGQTALLGSGNALLYSYAAKASADLVGTTSKTYDGTTDAALAVTNYFVNDPFGDKVTLNFPTLGHYSSPNVGKVLTVKATGLEVVSATSILGLPVYGLTMASTTATGIIGEIKVANLTISGLSGTNRIYDGTSLNALQGTAKIVGLQHGETFSLSGADFATLSSPNAGLESLLTHITLGAGTGLASNYKFDQPVLAPVVISPKELTVTGISGTNRDYNGNTLDLLTGTGVLHGLIGSEKILLNNTTTAQMDSANAGTRQLTSNFTLSNTTSGLAGNYFVTQPTLADVVISPAKLIVTGLSGTNRSYDGTTVDALVGTASLFGLIGNETLVMNNTNKGTLSSPDVGTRGVTSAVTLSNGANGGLASNYTLTQTTMPDVIISPAVLTVSGLAGTDRTYDGTTIDALTGTAILSGLVNQETLKLDLSSARTGDLSSPNAGSRSVTTHVTLQNGTGNASNYILTQAVLPNVNISPAILTVSGLSGTDRAYNGSAINLLTGSGSLSGLINGENVILTNAMTGTLSSANAGTRAITTNFKLSDDTGLASNYTILQPTLADVIISRARLVVTGQTGIDRNYNGTDIVALRGTPTLQGLVGDETLTLSNTTTGIIDSPNVGSRKVSTGIVLHDGTGLASNYTLDQQTMGNVNISPAILSVVGQTAQDKSYDGTTAAVVTGGTLGGTIYGNDDVHILLTAGQFATANAGKDIVVTTSGTLTGTGASNYVLGSSAGLTATINPKELTLSGLFGTDRRYDGTTVDALTGTATLHGLVGDETLNVGNTLTGTLSSANAGSRSVTTAINLADGSGLASNYTLTQAILPNVTISRALLTVTGLAGTDRTYDGTKVDTLTGTATLHGLVGDETLTVGNAATGTLSSADVGSRGVTTALTLVDGSGLASNYELAQPTLANVNISKALLTVTANDAQRSVGAPNPPFTATTTGYVAGEGASVLGGQLSFTTPATKDSPVGIYGISASGLEAANYSFQYVDGHLSIVPSGLGGNNLSVLATLPNPERDDHELPEALPSLNLLHVIGSGISLPRGIAAEGL
jgi:filamentous hemagglutinin family protein